VCVNERREGKGVVKVVKKRKMNEKKGGDDAEW
jgi:hypothetical protein